jgi:hypothetical protein
MTSIDLLYTVLPDFLILKVIFVGTYCDIFASYSLPFLTDGVSSTIVGIPPENTVLYDFTSRLSGLSSLLMSISASHFITHL